MTRRQAVVQPLRLATPGVMPAGGSMTIPISNAKKLICHTSSYGYLAKEVLAFNKDAFEPLRVERKRFPDSESYHRLEQRVRDRDVVIIGGTINERELMELYFMSCMM